MEPFPLQQILGNGILVTYYSLYLYMCLFSSLSIRWGPTSSENPRWIARHLRQHDPSPMTSCVSEQLCSGSFEITPGDSSYTFSGSLFVSVVLTGSLFVSVVFTSFASLFWNLQPSLPTKSSFVSLFGLCLLFFFFYLDVVTMDSLASRLRPLTPIMCLAVLGPCIVI